LDHAGQFFLNASLLNDLFGERDGRLQQHDHGRRTDDGGTKDRGQPTDDQALEQVKNFVRRAKGHASVATRVVEGVDFV